MAYLYNTQNTQNNFKSMEQSNSLDFSKNKFKNTLYNTLKSQNTNYSSFQNTKNLLNEQNIYSIIKLQYTLIYDFLSKINLSYTVNIFNNEIKSILNPATPYSYEEISKIIEINHNDSNIQTNSFNNNTFLDTLKNTYLYSLIYSKSNLLKVEKEIQTYNLNNDEIDNLNTIKKNNFLSSTTTKIDGDIFIQDIDEKLKKIDEKYYKKMQNDNLLNQNHLTNSVLLKYKNDLEKKYQEDLKNEIERIKTVEIGKIIIEENKKYLEKIELIRNEYENNYQLKFLELNEKEKKIKQKDNNLEDKYREKTKELLEKYQQKMNDLNKKESNFNFKCIKELNNIKEKKITLDKKERELYILKKDYTKEMQKEIEKIKTEFKQILKEQIEKIKYENEQELDKAKNKLKLNRINYDYNLLKDLNISKSNEDNYKEIFEIKKELSDIKKKISKNNKNKNGLLLPDNDLQKIENNLDYYEQISKLESKLNEIINKTKFKFYNINQNEEKNNSNLIIKDENIRKKIDELENEQNEINKEIEKDIKNIFNKEIPELNKEEIEEIKNNNYNKILYDLAKNKELNDLYKKELEEKNIKNKIEYIKEINQNIKQEFEKELNEPRFIIIDENEMNMHKQLFLKLYRQRREQQKIDEINKQKEKIRQRELKEKEIKERELKEIKDREEKEKEKREKSKDKKEEEKNIFSKSFQLPPVRNPKERKSSMIGNIGDLIIQKKEKDKNEDKKYEEEDEEYGSGDFIDISKEENKSKLEISKQEKEKLGDDVDLSEKIDMILNETHTEKISEQNEKGSSYYDDEFETSNALNLKGINTLNTDQDKNKSKKSIEESGDSNEEYKF